MQDDSPRSSLHPPPYAGPERRRVPPCARLMLSLDPGRWYPVVDRHPEAIPPEPPTGFVWLDLGSRLAGCWVGHLELDLAHPNPAVR
jgi:hypothetical protein